MSRKRKDEIVFDKSKIRYYYGIPHCHSNYSSGRGTPSELFEMAIKAGHDFLFITDHNSSLSVTEKDSKSLPWQSLQNAAAKIKKNNEDFLPVIGFESRTTNFGDINIINTKNFFTGTVSDLRLLTLWMLNNPDSFISINHPHKNVTTLKYEPLYNKLITSIEVCNGNPSSKITKHDKYYFYLLDRGWKLGAINGQDNHRANLNESENLTVCIANSLNKPSIIDSFRERRTYSTESKYLRFYFTVNDVFMGQQITLTNSKIKFMIYAEDIKYKITEIKILTSNGSLIKNIDNINLSSIKYFYEHQRDTAEKYYVIKVLEEGGKTAISSPIFVE